MKIKGKGQYTWRMLETIVDDATWENGLRR